MLLRRAWRQVTTALRLLVALIVLVAGIASGSTVVAAQTGVAANHHETVAAVAADSNIGPGHVGSNTVSFDDWTSGCCVAPKTAEGTIYLRVDNNAGEFDEYVGQTTDLPGRSKQHMLDHPDADFEFYELQTGIEPGIRLDIAEEDWIRAGGGPRSDGGSLANGRHQVAADRYEANGGTVSWP